MFETYKNKILSFYQNNKRMPGYAEMMSLTGFRSKNAVYKLVNKLVDAGILDKDKQGRLSPVTAFDEVPFLGLVEAGMPSVAEESVLDTMNLENYLIPNNKDKTYLLEVKGDSMIEAAIQEGDMVIAEKRSDAKVGDIVIAEVDGGWTMKYLRKKGNQFYLEPANKKYKPIYPTESFHIGAIVRGVIRKY